MSRSDSTKNDNVVTCATIMTNKNNQNEYNKKLSIYSLVITTASIINENYSNSQIFPLMHQIRHYFCHWKKGFNRYQLKYRLN